jgi:hypothetical protein
MGKSVRTICATLRGVRTMIGAHMADRGVGLKDKALAQIDEAISMAKAMDAKLKEYNKREG